MSSLGFNLGLGKIFWGAIKERGVEIHWAVQKAINLFFTTLQHKYAKLEKKIIILELLIVTFIHVM